MISVTYMALHSLLLALHSLLQSLDRKWRMLMQST